MVSGRLPRLDENRHLDERRADARLTSAFAPRQLRSALDIPIGIGFDVGTRTTTVPILGRARGSAGAIAAACPHAAS